jgi:hypothetical protein
VLYLLVLEEARNEIVVLALHRVGEYAPEADEVLEPPPDLCARYPVVGEYL